MTSRTRTLNFTERKTIHKDDLGLTLERPKAGPPLVSGRPYLSDYDLPASAKVYVEAYRGLVSQRIDCGTVGAPKELTKHKLDRVDLDGPILFRVKVVDVEEKPGLVLASCKGARPTGGDKGKTPLLPVNSYDLRDTPWRVDFAEDCVTLCVHSEIIDGVSLLREDPKFRALILPGAIREIIVQLIWHCRDEGRDEPPEWISDWLHFVKSIGEDPEALKGITDGLDAFDKASMIADMVCRNADLKNRLVEAGG